MIDVIIFSRDRAAQLDLLLRSIQLHSNGIFNKVTVLYTFTDESFMAGYVLAQDRHRKVKFITDNFQITFKNTLSKVISECDCDFVTFMTDDDILYRQVPVKVDRIIGLFEKTDLCCISLRLGQNTKVQDPYNEILTVFPKSVELDLPFVIWKWDTVPPHMNFGYPLSVDGHIFRTESANEFVSCLQYDNPNNFEGAMQKVAPLCKKRMACFTHSVLVNSPTNRVQSVCPNRAGEVYGECTKTMNNSFVRGWYIDFFSTDFNNIVGCHQEINFKWTDEN